MHIFYQSMYNSEVFKQLNFVFIYFNDGFNININIFNWVKAAPIILKNSVFNLVKFPGGTKMG